ncbi:MAG: hypothetical protein V3V52_02655 [Candidatus Adiutricales bacterium]
MGRPAAALITEPFIPTARAIAAVRGLPDYPFILLKHPLGSLNEDELKDRARDAALQALKIFIHGHVK